MRTSLLGATTAAVVLTAALAPVQARPAEGGAREEVRLHLTLSRRPHGTEAERDRIRELEEALLGLLAAAQAGELARDTWEGGVCVITIAARDARLAWSAVEAAVRAHPSLPGSFAVVRAGPEGAPEERIPLTPPT